MNSTNNITYIAGVARSGTSWLGQIFNSSPCVKFSFQPLFAYEFKNRVNEDSTAREFEILFQDMLKTDSDFLNQNDKCLSGDYPIFEKESDIHLVIKENRYQYLLEPMMRKAPNLKLVGIIRNPNAVLNSWMKNPKEFPEGSNPLNEWRYGDCKNKGHEDFFGYVKWKEVTNLYLALQQKWPDRVKIIRYEDLVRSPIEMTKDLFAFANITYSKQTDDFLRQSSDNHIDSPYAVFKNKKVMTQWQTELPEYITTEIKHDLAGTPLEIYIQP